MAKRGESKENHTNLLPNFLEKMNCFLNNKILVFCFLFLGILVIGLRYTSTLDDNDIWWHMKYGEYILKNLTLKVDHSIFSWTTADPNWVYNTPLSQVWFYLMWKLNGYIMLHITLYLIIISVIAMFIYYIRAIKLQLDYFTIFSILLVFSICHLAVVKIRPEIFSFLLLTIIFFIYFYVKKNNKDIFYLYPILMVIWVNTHGVFIFGVLFMTLVLIGEVLNYLFLRNNALQKPLLKSLALMTVLSYFAMLVNPYGIKLILNIFISFFDVQFMKQAEALIAYKPLFWFGHPAKYFMIIMVLIYIVLTLYLGIKKRHFDIAVFIANLVFCLWAFKYGRSVYYYPLLWFFSVFYLISKLNMKAEKPNLIYKLVGYLTPLLLIINVLFSLWIVSWSIYTPFVYSHIGFGPAENMPVKAGEFLKKYKIEGTLYNSYEIGGYLIWALPEYRVFIDPRHGPYAKHLMDEALAFDRGENFEFFIKKYPFKIAIFSTQWIYLFGQFYKHPDWELLYFDEAASIFVHKSVNLPKDISIDLSVERFNNNKSYEAFIYPMFVYAFMKDFKSARYLLEIVKQKYNYGYFTVNLLIAEDKLRELEKKHSLVNP